MWIYGTNIYKLYDDIVKEYGQDWIEDEIDIDLPFVISKKEHLDTLYYKDSFTNIILVFDYERHDPQFSVDKILKMQECFKDSTDVGKLYLNYPMIEAYKHLKSFPDLDYLERKISVSLKPGDKYKNLVKEESIIEKAVDFPHRIEDLLAGKRYNISDEKKRKECCNAILSISNENIEGKLNEILHILKDDKKEKTLKYQLKDWITKIGYIQENKSYWQYMRKVFQEVICYNICKAYRIEKGYNDEIDLKLKFEDIDLIKILEIQNQVSSESINGYIWVLSTCLFLIPDYNFKLII